MSFDERYEYLRLTGVVGESTFGFDRYLNQILYTSMLWQRVRDDVIVRDNGCDLGLLGYEIRGMIVVHHMNPIDIDDIRRNDERILNPEFLICTSFMTHKAIHYGNRELLLKLPITRHPGDTIPWRKHSKKKEV